MQTTATTRKVAVLVLTALIIVAALFAGASAITADDAHAGTRVGTSPGSRDST